MEISPSRHKREGTEIIRNLIIGFKASKKVVLINETWFNCRKKWREITNNYVSL